MSTEPSKAAESEFLSASPSICYNDGDQLARPDFLNHLWKHNMTEFMKTLSVLTVLLAGLSACTQQEAVVFSAMGCGPYGAADEQALIHYMKREARPPQSDFIVHLGDIAGQSAESYGEDYFARIAAILSDHHQVPTFVVPGDNEWNDQPDPAAAWQHWVRHLMHFDKRFESKPEVWRQPQRRVAKRGRDNR